MIIGEKRLNFEKILFSKRKEKKLGILEKQ